MGLSMSDVGDFYENPWKSMTGRRHRSTAATAPTYGARDRLAEARRQRAAGITAPASRGFQMQGLKPGDPGYWQDRSRSYLWRDQTGGWDSLLRSFEGGATTGNAMQDLLTTFQGSREELADFMEVAGPMMGGMEADRIRGGDAMAFMEDQGNWDMGAMAGYGGAAGAVGQATRRAKTRSGAQLAAAGLGRGSARSAIDASLDMQAAAQQGDLRARATQQAAQNRMQSAGNLMDAHRMLAQLALGQGVTPRINSPQGGGGGVGWQQGALAGGMAGAALGPWGALIGAGVGAGIGAAG